MIRNTRRKGEVAGNIDAAVGQRLRELRMLAGLSQNDLATAIGLTFQQLQKYERGINRISASTLYQMACHLNVPIALFFADLNTASAPTPASADSGPRSREALVLARNFQRITDQRVRSALRAFTEACASQRLPRPESPESLGLAAAVPAG